MIYIKLQGDVVSLGGSVATNDMLNEGWIEYTGTVPEYTKSGSLRFINGELIYILDEQVRAQKLKDFEAVPEQYIYNYYNAGTQLSLARFRQVGSIKQKNLVNQIDEWMAAVLTDYYTRRYMLQIATTPEELDAISLDLSNNNATKPNIQLSTIFTAV